ncbi:MAG: nitronate monooxygenase [Peptostreptococcaceae bacterium]|nr:nitronate monooxygenase [Peptostreptococcaceae bacterium]
MTYLKSIRIGDLIARIPIIQGGMGIGISLSRLAGTVAKNGGIGVISVAQIGYREEDFAKDPLAANLRALEKEIRKAREIAEGGVLGVNIMCAANHYEKYVQCSVENNIDIIFSGAGLPTELPALVRDSGVKIAPIIAPPKAAKTLLRLWDRKYRRTADMVVIEGSMAGGHLGFSSNEIERCRSEGYDKEILEILEIVSEFEEKYDRKIPVIFGGGVFDHNDIRHYLDLGCAGVQMGTRFVATKECDASESFKHAYIKAKEKDIIIKKSPVGMPGRAIKNKLLQETEKEKRRIQHCYQCLQSCDRSNIPYCITSALISAAEGDLDNALIFCGENVKKIDKIITVEELFQELCGEAGSNE